MKDLGQHFLINPEKAGKIAQACRLSKEDWVVEIGPGKGVLTREILPLAGKTIAVELDPGLYQALRKGFAPGAKLQLVHADFLKLDLEPILPPDRKIKWIGNLPYSVASAILQKALAWPSWETAVFMFQKEVAERLRAGPGTRKYGILTLSAQIHAEVEWVLEVPAEDFKPRPKVESAVLRFKRRAEPLVAENDREKFFKIVHAAFQQRRKTILNSLSHGLKLEKSEVEKALALSGIEPSKRAEEIPLEGFLGLLQNLKTESL